jgi:uncharacterized ferritin-like protein (DUF455 family)
MTDLRTWAERLLLGEALADKLAPLPDGAVGLPDEGPALAVPAAPGRPAELRFVPRSGEAAPSEGRLADPLERGRLLHAFANHELLAIELFALGLVRFPDAPASWRAGVAATIGEEQRHLAAYLARMAELGVRFGDAAPSGFFWSCLAASRSPLELVAGLSLGFEQANLDFAAHWASALRAVGDEPSAALLDRVLADEVGHVRHGVVWLERWKGAVQSPWDAWRAALRPPLTPRRARGRGPLLVEARRAAGLTDDFIRRLRLEGQSTGRPPVVHLFRPTIEEEHARASQGGPTLGAGPVTAPVAALARDQAALPLFLSRPGDVVLVPERPGEAWLEELATAGVELPELVVVDGEDVARAVGDRPLSGLRPWGWSPDVARLLAPLAPSVRPTAAPWTSWVPTPDQAYELAPFFGKPYGVACLATLLAARPDLVALAGGPEVVGRRCTTEAEVQTALETIPGRAVVKARFGSSGRGAIRVDGASPDVNQAGWIRNTLERHGAVVVEPWLARTVDLSAQLLVRGPDDVALVGLTRFLTDARGQYLGHVVGPYDSGLDAPTRRLLATGGRASLEVAARHVGLDLARWGFRGHAGVDALVHRADGGEGPAPVEAMRLKPIVEVNPRTTMGLVALDLGRLLRPGQVGLWRHVTTSQAKRAGLDLAALAARVRALAPLVVSGGRLERGALFTNDPSAAQAVLGVLLVGDCLEASQVTLDALLGG